MDYRSELEAGRDAFGHLIKVWHERNGWSQRVLPALAERLELGRVHNSQLSNLRNRKLASPGPELFVALGRINQLLAQEAGAHGVMGGLAEQLADQLELLSALQASALPLLADDGAALGPAQLFEIFVGLRSLPAGFDLRIQAAEAAGLSAALAELFTAGRPWRLCREPVLAAYPVEKRQRRERREQAFSGGPRRAPRSGGGDAPRASCPMAAAALLGGVRRCGDTTEREELWARRPLLLSCSLMILRSS